MLQRKLWSRALIILVFSCFAIGCTGLTPGYETPAVTVSSFNAVSGPGAAPKFEIGLHIVNPNRTDLPLKGVAYTIAIEGHNILTGVANDLPVVKAYGQEDIVLTGSVSLLNSIAFFADLAGRTSLDGLSYSLKAKLDPGAFHPVIRVNKKGIISLGSPQ